jgi:hypothetical protein
LTFHCDLCSRGIAALGSAFVMDMNCCSVSCWLSDSCARSALSAAAMVTGAPSKQRGVQPDRREGSVGRLQEDRTRAWPEGGNPTASSLGMTARWGRRTWVWRERSAHGLALRHPKARLSCARPRAASTTGTESLRLWPQQHPPRFARLVRFLGGIILSFVLFPIGVRGWSLFTTSAACSQLSSAKEVPCCSADLPGLNNQCLSSANSCCLQITAPG